MARGSARLMRTYRIDLAWPAVDRGDQGIEMAVAHELVTRDGLDGEHIEMTERHMRLLAQTLRLFLPRDVRFYAVGPDKTSGDTRDFPFTHHMVIDDDEWQEPRDWAVTLVEDEDGDITRFDVPRGL